MSSGSARHVAAAVLTMALCAPVPADAIVPMSRDDIIARAATGVGSPYWWGHACWRSWDEGWGGADCSGFVGRVWNVPIEVATDYNCNYHPYSTYNFKYESWHWASIARSSIARADALVRHASGAGHIAIYASGDPWGCQELYEAQCTACGIRHQTRCLDSSYVARRRDNLITCVASTEVCDGIDNDCDGATDEGNPGGGASCGTGIPGVCAAGVTACISGGLACLQLTSASAEVCDGLDNDCDGTVDDGNPGGGAACNTGLPGVCAAGETACSGAGLGCVQLVAASAEVCDGLDNDCDGPVDEGVCHDAELVGESMPAQLVACATYDVSLTFLNVGTSTWTTADGFGLRYLAGVTEGPEWLDVPVTTPPGSSATFELTLTTGLLEGSDLPVWCMETSGECFGESAHPSLDILPPLYRAELVDSSYPQSLPPGETAGAWVVVRNTGSSAWPPRGVVLGTIPAGERSALWTPSWDAYDVAATVENEVAPGETARIPFDLGCPEEIAGLLEETFELRTPEGEAFYCGATGLTFEVNVRPSPHVAASETPEAVAEPVVASGGCSVTGVSTPEHVPLWLALLGALLLGLLPRRNL